MPVHSSIFGVWVSVALAGLAHAHEAGWHKAIYCLYGNETGVTNWNNNQPVQPLWNLTYDQWFMHAINSCNKFPPAEGVFLDLPAGGTFTLEWAVNLAKTTLSPQGEVSEWPDGQDHPEGYNVPTCITSPNLHTQNESMAAGTALALSPESDITKVTLESLTIITVRYHTPFKRVVTYDVPSGLPSCPPDGCICTMHWIPNGCGEPNMYMMPYRCRVIPDSTPPKTIAPARAAVWCEDDPSNCTTGAKYPMIWNQLEGNNIVVEGSDLSGHPKSPAYNMKCGFKDGAQTDIFLEDVSTTSPSATGSSTSALPSSSSGSSLPAGSGTPTLSPSDPASSLPSGSGTSTLPSVSNVPTGSSTPTLPTSAPVSSSLPGSGTSTLPSSATASYLPTGSSTPTSALPSVTSSAGSSTSSAANCKAPAQESISTHSKRMKMHRKAHGIF